MRVVFLKKEQSERIIKDIKKSTGAQIVTTDKHACTSDLCRNKYGRAEPK